MERLTALRGKGIPSLYSWSCKRSYKNGYVWNDLTDNDIIPPSDGAEYVLKGSELVPEIIEHLQIRNRVHHSQEPSISLDTKRKSPTSTLTQHRASAYEEQDFDEDEEKEDEYELDEEKTCYTSSTTPHSRCSRGVSTNELEDQQEPPKTVSQSAQQHSSLLSTSSNDKQNQSKNSTSIRFEDDEPVGTESAPSRSSVLLQLIACGNLAVNKAKNVAIMKQPVVQNKAVVKKGENLHRGVLCKCAVKKVVEDDEMIIEQLSENPRFGNLQAEEKEYFSGSIVESMNSEKPEPMLKKSNSYNEERRCKVVGETVEEKEKDKSVTGKCIPRKKSSKQNQKMRID
ncbi:protein UPSTREAM OF FLC-like [Hibiscus syriacus]|uniref:protein UPSTREAM OF FLC-like n=1 Tax=Hibiscus syriacus TaxID=106335 RepID=UPI001924F7D7|nr:protein UPSTREAM OF FLC-like [Hibiscus syriacus]